MNLVLAGRARYLVKDRRYDLQPRTLVWLFPSQEHILLDCSADFRMWIVVFRQRLVRDTRRDSRYVVLRERDPGLDWLRRLAQPEAERLDALLRELQPPAEGSLLLFNAGLRYLLLAALEAFRRAEHVGGGTEVHPAVEKAVRILKEESADLSEEALAGRVGLSRSHLSRLFRRQTGVSLVQFRNRQRLRRFLDLYGAGQRLTMLAAALAAGFGSYAQFHRVFRASMGRAPADYRRQQS